MPRSRRVPADRSVELMTPAPPSYLTGLHRLLQTHARLIPAAEEPAPVTHPRRSAVLMLLAGDTIETASIGLEERGHALRSQPGQFSLPGGGIDPTDASPVAAALREAREEIGLRSDAVQVLGAFRPIPMPVRGQEVTPVVSWSPERPEVYRASPVEVESIHWAALVGEGSLSDPQVRRHAVLDGRDVGIAFDLPDDVFVWGFTAWMLERLRTLIVDAEDAAQPGTELRRIDVPPLRRRR